MNILLKFSCYKSCWCLFVQTNIRYITNIKMCYLGYSLVFRVISLYANTIDHVFKYLYLHLTSLNKTQKLTQYKQEVKPTIWSWCLINERVFKVPLDSLKAALEFAICLHSFVKLCWLSFIGPFITHSYLSLCWVLGGQILLFVAYLALWEVVYR